MNILKNFYGEDCIHLLAVFSSAAHCNHVYIVDTQPNVGSREVVHHNQEPPFYWQDHV